MNRRYLVTGAGGFIGSAIVRELVSKQQETFSLVRSQSNLWRLPGESANHHYVKTDLLDYPNLKKKLLEIKPTHIFHLATYGVYRDQLDPQLIFDNNLTGTDNLLKISSQLPLDTFINTGSVYEYSDLPGARSEAITGTPRNPYDTVKIESTKKAIEFAKEKGLPLCTLRIFTAFGSFEDQRRLVGMTILSFLNNKETTISPTPIRDFVFLEDIVSAYLKASDLAPKKGEVINIGNGKPVLVGEVVNKLVDLIKPKVIPQMTDQFVSSNDSRCWADISAAKKLIDWSPQFSLDQGLGKTVDWFKQNQNLYGI